MAKPRKLFTEENLARTGQHHRSPGPALARSRMESGWGPRDDADIAAWLLEPIRMTSWRRLRAAVVSQWWRRLWAALLLHDLKWLGPDGEAVSHAVMPGVGDRLCHSIFPSRSVLSCRVGRWR